MITTVLQDFVNDVVAAREITRGDVLRLQRDVLPQGVESRDEADILVALDRAVLDKHAAWSGFVIQAVADYVVWATRPTGYVDAETSSWLTRSISAGRGPTEIGVAIAFEVVREAERADEILLTFLMRSATGRLLHAAEASGDDLFA